MYDWFLNDGTNLTGKDAEEYLIKRLACLKDLSKEIDRVINECISLNVVEEDDSPVCAVMETGERISMIQILLETLLEDIQFKL